MAAQTFDGGGGGAWGVDLMFRISNYDYLYIHSFPPIRPMAADTFEGERGAWGVDLMFNLMPTSYVIVDTA